MIPLQVPKRFIEMQAKDSARLWSNDNEWCREAEHQLAIHGILVKIMPFPPGYHDYQPLLFVDRATYKGVDEIRYYCEAVNANPNLAGHQIGYDVAEPLGIKRKRAWERP